MKPSLPAMLSHALVAFTIELDNEFERRMPHTTTMSLKAGHPPAGPWLASFVMWANFLRFVPEDGAQSRDIAAFAGVRGPVHPALAGMQRWGYVNVTPVGRGRGEHRVSLTEGGRLAAGIWDLLPGEITARWLTRFGAHRIKTLRAALCAVLEGAEEGLPDYLPIVNNHLHTEPPVGLAPQAPAELNLPAQLAQVLLQLTLSCEQGAPTSLPVAANVLRVLDSDGVPVRDLPRITGISKEAVTWSLKRLVGDGYASIETGAGRRARLTRSGRAEQTAHDNRVKATRATMAQIHGEETIGALEAALTSITGDGTATSPLWPGIAPYPDGWRASIPAPNTLPHHPVVLHRGGYPDGS